MHQSLRVMQNSEMRTTINFDEDVHEFVTVYSAAKGISLSAATNELIRKAESAPAPEPEIVFSEDGLPMFPPARKGRVLTSEMVKRLDEEEYDPKKFT